MVPMDVDYELRDAAQEQQSGRVLGQQADLLGRLVAGFLALERQAYDGDIAVGGKCVDDGGALVERDGQAQVEHVLFDFGCDVGAGVKLADLFEVVDEVGLGCEAEAVRSWNETACSHGGRMV